MMFSGIDGYHALPCYIFTIRNLRHQSWTYSCNVPMGLRPPCLLGKGHVIRKIHAETQSWTLSSLELQIQFVSHIRWWIFSLSLTLIKKFHRKNRSENLQQSHHSEKKTSTLALIIVYHSLSMNIPGIFPSLLDLSLWIVINASTRPPTCPVRPPLGPGAFPPPTSLGRGDQAETEVRFLLKKAKCGVKQLENGRCRDSAMRPKPNNHHLVGGFNPSEKY